MKKSLGIVLAAALSLGTFAAVAAEVAEHHGHGRHMRDGMRGGMRGEMFMGPQDLEKLNLTAEQKTKLEGIRKGQHEQMRSQMDAGRADHEALMQELYKDKPDQALISQKLAAIEQRQAAAMNAHVQAMLEFNQSLTPEQRTQMQTLMAEHKQKRAEMRQKWEQRRQEKQNTAPTPTPDK
jgi:Spy/CpxP family protein refolding chaperone